MAGFSSIIEGCRNIYCDSPFGAEISAYSIVRSQSMITTSFAVIVDCELCVLPRGGGAMPKFLSTRISVVSRGGGSKGGGADLL